MNTGQLTTSKRLYQYTIQDIDQKFSKEIVMGVNKGNFHKGATSKGINQLEAMIQVNRNSRYLMKVGSVAKVGGDLLTLATMMVDVANGDKMSIPLMPPFVPMIVDNQMQEMYDDFHEDFMNRLNNALLTGNMQSVAKVANESSDEDIKRGYEMIFIDDGELEKLLNNEIKTKYDLNYIEAPNREIKNGLLIQYQEDVKDEYGRTIYVFYIHAIFISEFITLNKPE